jgi:amino acid permease
MQEVWLSRGVGSPDHAHATIRGLPQGAAHAALLTAALALPQGLLALPIALAQAGFGPGLLILLLAGALNTVSVAWTARHTAAAFARDGAVPSLVRLAESRLGASGRLLAIGGGGGLFFLAFVASVVGLARSLEAGTQAPAWLWGAGCGLLVLSLAAGGAQLSVRLLAGVGLLNLCLLATLLVLLLPHVEATATARPTQGGPLLMVGVSLMLFFAPMLTPQVARQALRRGADPRGLVWGSAGGVALSAGLCALWAVAVCGSTDPDALAAAPGTAIPLLLEAAPVLRLPATLLVLLLLGMTALRCALVLKALAEEQLPQRARACLAQAPAALGLAVALALLVGEVSSFAQLTAVGGAGCASVVSLLLPALIETTCRRSGAAERT